MTRAAYFKVCMSPLISVAILQQCLDNPISTLRPRHLALIRLALRKRGA